MPTTIWKKVLEPAAIQQIEVPEGAEFLTARDQMEQVCIWYRCDPDRPMQRRNLAMYGTGHTMMGENEYIGTGFLHGGQLVLHVFEVPIG